MCVCVCVCVCVCMHVKLCYYKSNQEKEPWAKYASAAAAKSLQSWLTLCAPIDGSPPGSPVPVYYKLSGRGTQKAKSRLLAKNAVSLRSLAWKTSALTSQWEKGKWGSAIPHYHRQTRDWPLPAGRASPPHVGKIICCDPDGGIKLSSLYFRLFYCNEVFTFPPSEVSKC